MATITGHKMTGKIAKIFMLATIIMAPLTECGANEIYDYWYNSVLPHYQLSINDIASIDESSAVLMQPITETSGIRIKMSTTRTDGAQYDIVCFFACNYGTSSPYYEALTASDNICMDCKYGQANCEIYWVLPNACKPCPQDDGMSDLAVVISPMNPTYHDIRDCAYASGATGADNAGKFTFTDNCHYSK